MVNRKVARPIDDTGVTTGSADLLAGLLATYLGIDILF